MAVETEIRFHEGTVSFFLLEMVEDVSEQEVELVRQRLRSVGFSSFDQLSPEEKRLFVVFDKLNDKEREFVGKLKQNHLPGLHDIKTTLMTYNLTLGRKERKDSGK